MGFSARLPRRREEAEVEAEEEEDGVLASGAGAWTVVATAAGEFDGGGAVVGDGASWGAGEG